MGNGLISIVVGGALIFAALSGMTMRGTNSSGALGAIGGIVLVIGIVRIVKSRSQPPPGS